MLSQSVCDRWVKTSGTHFGHEQQASKARASVSPASPKQRLEACDSLGFERGTLAHAECAMKLYMNEQNQGTANAVTSSNNQQTAALARQQAIQEATLPNVWLQKST